jgi:hypothetical protein
MTSVNIPDDDLAAVRAEMEAELAADEEAEIIAQIQAEEELSPDELVPDWYGPAPPDEELDAAFWEAADKDD